MIEDIYEDNNIQVWNDETTTSVVVFANSICLTLPIEEMVKVLTSLACASVELKARQNCQK